VPDIPPEDPFADLGAEEAGRRRRQAIGDALAERDRVAPEPMERRPEVPRPGNKYAWVVGIVMLMGIGVLLFTTALPNSGEGLKGPQRGDKLKVFAAPSATGDVTGDANVRQNAAGSESAGPVPACEVHLEGVVNFCLLRERPVVLTFIFDRGAECYPQVDRVERMRGEFEDVNFATVFFSRKDRDELREIVERRGWTQPVAVDSDGAITNLYGVGGCPITVFSREGGVVQQTALGNLTEDQLRARTRRLLRG
jgi:AhpC/TSA family protein